MAAIEEGRVCLLTHGRRAGQEVKISKIVDDNFVMVNDGKKERKVSMQHLEPKE